ncbi:hypothetical protein ACFL3C_04535 [Patescibacteria group bacterium]
MNDKHYFSDITELFLKAKKEEQIEVNPQIKNAVREMLKYKISEVKGSGNTSQDKPDIFGFFRKWRYQLVAVPASLMAIMVVVFAASNLQFAIPKDDLTTDIQRSSEIAQTEIDEPFTLVADLEEDEIDPTEADRALLQAVTKTGGGPLSININDLGKIDIRTLNKIPQAEPETYIADNTPSVPGSKELLSSGTILDFGNVNFVLPKMEFEDKPEVAQEVVEDEPNEVVQDELASEPGAEDENQAENPSEPVSEPETYVASAPEEDTQPTEEPTEIIADDAAGEEPTELFDEDAPLVAEKTITEEYTASSMMAMLPKEEQTLKRIYTEREQVFVKEVKEEAYPVYYFRDSTVATSPEFDESLLKNISEKSLPSSMTVYYTGDNKVVVEMALEGDSTTKWYLFEKVNGSWTIQKYEKEILDGVVK